MITIAWGSILLVLVVSIVAACSVVGIYATGLRLWSTADTMAGKYSVAADGTVGPAAGAAAAAAPMAVRAVRAAAVSCFVLSGLVVLWGILLLIPQFSGH